MNRKTFKYEGKNKKNIRLKDVLMLLSVFVLSIITVTVTSDLSGINGEKNFAETLVQSTELPIEEETKITASEESVESLPPVQLANNVSSEPSEPDFIKPVDGMVIKGYSPDELIYSETMDDWRLHTGVDISSPIGGDVLAADDGIIKELFYDINLGNCLILECGEYTMKYCSLSTEYFVDEGQRVSKGELIAKSSDSAMSEICEEPHVHLEMMKSNEAVNPEKYINFK